MLKREREILAGQVRGLARAGLQQRHTTTTDRTLTLLYHAMRNASSIVCTNDTINSFAGLPVNKGQDYILP